MGNDTGAAHHMNVYGLTGLDWWAYKLLPARWAAAYLSKSPDLAGRETFTLMDGSTWRILRPGAVEPTKKPDLGGAR